ncbi:MAG TPA: hypothetical protein VFW74_15490, partial [Acidimicrobiia bacterium]|nr:hypothetical protein [Acidimicrobiia bacterium]
SALVGALHLLTGVSVRSLHVERDDETRAFDIVAGLTAPSNIDLDQRLAELAVRDDVDEVSLGERS